MSYLGEEFETKKFVWPIQEEVVEQHLKDGWMLYSREPAPPGDGPQCEVWILREPPAPSSRRRLGAE